MKNTKIQRNLIAGDQQTNNNPYAGRKHVRINEKSFLSNVVTNAKEFVKKSIKNVKASAKKIFMQFKREYMGGKKRTNFLPGKMIAFQYRAKDATKKYDANPLVISLGPVQNEKLRKTHFIGLNLHWLPISDRVAVASFFTELNKKRGGELVYNDVKPFMKKFKGHQVLRMYIIDRVSNKVIEMPTDMFLTAAALPSETWMGGK